MSNFNSSGTRLPTKKEASYQPLDSFLNIESPRGAKISATRLQKKKKEKKREWTRLRINRTVFKLAKIERVNDTKGRS